MKTVKIILFNVLLLHSYFLFSQITITEIEKREEKIVMKPEPYDSLKNWEQFEKMGDYKKYIGLQIYLPPFSNPKMNSDPNYDSQLLLLSITPVTIPVNTPNKLLEINNMSYDSILTYVYRPYHYFSGKFYGYCYAGISPNSNLVSNNYYTIIDVIYGEKMDKLWKQMDSLLSRENILSRNNNTKYKYIDWKGFDEEKQPSKLLMLRNDKDGDTLYCRSYDSFILVPYFVKQKELCLNKYFIYDDGIRWGSYINEPFTVEDNRFIVKYEDNNGYVKNTGKKIIVSRGSKWLCSDVTLLKPSYEIHYILKNDNDEQIALKNIGGFVELNGYIKRESDNKLQLQQLETRQKQEKLISIENKNKAIEKHKAECISLFGKQNGELIAQGKVQIGMSKEMCKVAWGKPYWTDKSTTEYYVSEDWYYGFGFSLHFNNGILKRIDE